LNAEMFASVASHVATTAFVSASLIVASTSTRNADSSSADFPDPGTGFTTHSMTYVVCSSTGFLIFAVSDVVAHCGATAHFTTDEGGVERRQSAESKGVSRRSRKARVAAGCVGIESEE
jgi:hypothetical protein